MDLENRKADAVMRRIVAMLSMLVFVWGCAVSELEQDANQGGPDVGAEDVDEGDGDFEDVGDGDVGDSDVGDRDVGDGDGDGGHIDLCPSGCATNETCTHNGCVDLCAQQGYHCGSWNYDGYDFECGGCPNGFCDEGVCANLCDEFVAQCGSVFWEGSAYDCGTCSGVERCRYNQCAAAQGFVDIAAGNGYSCALRPNGEMRCWGVNGSGQLGNNNRPNTATTPQVVSSMNTASRLDGLNNHTCVTREDSQVRCWGANNNGQLGDMTTNDAQIPVTASGVTSAADIAVGGSHSCALLGNRRVRCWGNNGQGQLGNGELLNNPSFNHQKSNVRLQTGQDLEQVIDLSLGSAFSCAVRSDNTAWCWGFNNSGQLGLGSNADGQRFATRLSTLDGVQRLDAGNNHSCALAVGGQVYCWGHGSDGQIGHGLSSHSFSPVAVTLPGRAVSVAAGGFHSCAALESGQVYCWGRNEYGQLGNGSSQSSNTPVQVTGLGNVHIVSAGFQHSCALDRTGQAFCWGRNHTGQLGEGTMTDRSTPVAVGN